jgi:hypothetical protein
MALPETVRVKLSTEAAGSISLTPVVAREMPVRELVDHMLGVTGKDEARIRELLRRGTLVSGASRFRWAGWEADAEGLRELLATFPDADPARKFAAERSFHAVLRGGRQAIELPREAAARKGMFQRASFWDALMGVAAEAAFEYAGYSYRDRADRFLAALSVAETERVHAAATAVRFNTLRQQIRGTAFTQLEVLVTR